MDCPETFYHVLSRGNERKDIFWDERDYLRFLDTMGRMVKRFNLGIHAYVLMSLLKVRKYRCPNRDMAIYLLYQLGIYLNKEIGEVFDVGHTAVPGAAKRAQEYVRSDGRLERAVKRIIADI